jgi:CheY-like chemotaxis protein
MRLLGLTVLVVEDDVDNLELISSFLEGEGARTLSAGSIAGALALCNGQKLDAIVSDLELPDGDGCELLNQLKTRDGVEAPAIAVSGYSEQKWRNRAAGCGFERYAVKPFSLDTLADWIAELSRAHDPRDAAAASHSSPLLRVAGVRLPR